MTVKAKLLSTQGKTVGEVELADSLFGVVADPTLVHQAVVRDEAGARLGLANTRTRGDVSGGGRKPWRQKGTGRARQGSTRAPHWKGGGVVFGPHPRTYEQRMPRRMWRKAMSAALSAKFQAGKLHVVESFPAPAFNTKAQAQFLSDLGLTGTILLVTAAASQELTLSLRNLPHVSLETPATLSVRSVAANEHIVLDKAALEQLQQQWGMAT